MPNTVLGDLSKFVINGNEMNIKDAALTETVDEIIYAIQQNNQEIGDRINDLHTRLETIEDTDYIGVTSFNGETGAVTYTAPVTSVNGQTGAVTIDTGVTSFNGSTGAITYTAPVTSVNGQTGAVNITIPSKTSDLTNDSNFTTLAEVQTAIVNSAPETLDTLNELATALGNDPNFATTITNQIGQKYTKPSTGIPASDLADGVIPDVPVTSVNGMTGDVVIPESGVTSFNGATGAITYTAPVQSVNGQTGAVTIDTGVTSFNGATGVITYTAPVTSVDGKTGAVTIDHPVTSVNGQTGAVNITIPDAQIQADWNQTITTAKDYIKNKPDIVQTDSPIKEITILSTSNSNKITVGDSVSIGRNGANISIGSRGGDDETIRLTSLGNDGGVYVSTDTKKFYYNDKEVAVKDDIKVTSVNGQTGAVTIDTGVTSFNGSTGAITYTAPVTSVNGQTGAVTIDTGVTSFNGATGAITYTAPVTSVDGKTGAVTIDHPVTSVNGITGAVITQLSSNYAPNTGLNNQLDLAVGDTYENAFGKLEKLINVNEQISAAALNRLNDRINEEADPLTYYIHVSSTTTNVGTDIYNEILEALSNGRKVCLLLSDDGSVYYLPLIIDGDNIDGEFDFEMGYGDNRWRAYIYDDGEFGYEIITLAYANHTHGDLQSNGQFTQDITIANGDKIVITDASAANANSISRSSITFDGSTTNQVLSKKGTWVNLPENAVTSVNGQTGAVTIDTGVTSFNGSTGAVTYTAPVTSVNGQTGAVTIDLTGKADKSAAIGSLQLSINSTDYKVTLSGTKVDGTAFTCEDVIDLPLETMVVSGAYDDTTQKIVLTLKNGTTTDFPVSALIDGLQSEITSTNKLSADLISDGNTNKVVTQAEKDTWNNKVTSVNGQTGVVTIDTGVTSFNGQTGVVTYTAPVTSVNGQTGAVTIDTGVTSFNGQTGAVTYTAPVTSVNGQTGVVVTELSSEYATSTAVNDELELAAGDTYEEAFGKIEKALNDHATITATALNTLAQNSQLNTIESISVNGVPVPIDSSKNVDITISNDNDKVIAEALIDLNDRLEVVEGISAGDENIIEVVKVNGTALVPDANKAVDISVPVDLADLTDDTTHRLVTDTEKSTWNNKVTSVNGQTGDVTLSIPTKTSDITNDSGFITDAGVTSFNGQTGAITYTAPVTSVNGQTGAVTIDTGVASFNGQTGAVTYTAPVTSVNGQTGAVNLSIPDAVTESTVAGWGFTKNTGTLTTETQLSKGTATGTGNAVTDINVSNHQITLVKGKTFLETAPVTSVNGQTGAVTIDTGVTSFNGQTGAVTYTAPVTSVNGQTGAVTVKANVQSDWNATTGDAVILNKPTIPTVNDSTVTLTMNGNTVGTFTLNKSGNTTIDLGTVLTSHQSIKTINNQTITGTGNVSLNTLPTVSASDNGKVLMVVNGAWQLVTPVSLYSGSTAPSNSQGNNGDIYVQS